MRRIRCYATEITFLFGSKCNLELSDFTHCGFPSTLVCVCSHLSNSRRQIKLKCPEQDFSGFFSWPIMLQQWDFQVKKVFLLQAEITGFSTASRCLAAHSLGNTYFCWELKKVQLWQGVTDGNMNHSFYFQPQSEDIFSICSASYRTVLFFSH